MNQYILLSISKWTFREFKEKKMLFKHIAKTAAKFQMESYKIGVFNHLIQISLNIMVEQFVHSALPL